MGNLRVTFEPTGRAVHVISGTTLLEAATRAGLLLRSPCGGQGTCGKCRVRISQGECPPSSACLSFFRESEISSGWRLACQAMVTCSVVIEVPEESLFESNSQILISATGESCPGTPSLRTHDFALMEPTLEDARSDVERLRGAISIDEMPLPLLQMLPDALRANGYCGKIVLNGRHPVDVLPPGENVPLLAAAFDLGTTTIVGTLVDLVSGQERAVVAEMNPQISLGDDVISRITLAREGPERVAEMQQVVIARINDMLGQLAGEANVRLTDIRDVSLAGNTTMQHFFCGISPAALGEVPFAPAYGLPLDLRCSDLGISVHPLARIFVFPNIGGFVGGDTVAGCIAHDLLHVTSPTMLVDIGTNGEIVLACDGKIMATSCAAGPAFEGARISAGMRAASGAIEKVVMGQDGIICNVIGGGKASGICGTALIDATAEMLRWGILDPTGRIRALEEIPENVPEKVRQCLITEEAENHLILVSGEESLNGEPVILRQADVRELQLASGAIRAGVSIMMRKVGLSPEDLGTVLLAGGFGNYIRRENACAMGLLPELPIECIHYVGNAASMGAKAVLTASELRDTTVTIATIAEHVDLSLDPEFQMEFGMAMMFPDHGL